MARPEVTLGGESRPPELGMPGSKFVGLFDAGATVAIATGSP
jgi:hypothetical protein